MITQLSQIERSLSKITNPSYQYQLSLQSTVQGSVKHLSMSQSQFIRSKITTTSHPESQFLLIDNDILEIYNDFEKNYNTIQEFDKVNTKVETKMKQNDQQKQNQQQKKKLLKTFDGLQQSDLEIEYINRIAINKNQRALVQNNLSYIYLAPLQILLNFPQKIQSTQYKLFVSTSIEFPNKFNADQTVQSRFIKINSKMNAKIFFDDFVYLTFYSEFDAVIGMQITFGEQYIQSHGQKMIQSMISLDNFHERRTFHPKDKILQNIEQVKIKSSSKLEEMLKVKHRHTKSQETIQRSKNIQQELKQTRLIKLLVKDQIAQFREVEKYHQKERLIQIFIQKHWIQIIKQFEICETIFYKLQEIRKKNKIAAKANLLVWQLYIKALVEVRRYGENPLIRSLSKTSLVLNSYTLQIKDKCQIRAEKIMSKFLVDIILYQTFMNKHSQLIAKIKCIQKNYRKLRLVRKNFKEKFMKAFKEKIQSIYQGRGGDQKPRVNIEQHIITKLFEEYSNKIKHQWINSRRALNVLSTLKKSFSIQRQDIKLYQLPEESEMQLILQNYYKIKKQMN